MGTPHINANPGDFANVVLMPGDPLRAKLIAEKFLLDYKEVTNVRGILGYTGYTKNGKRLSVMASGMGLPSIGIYSHELFTHYGVDTIIRVGTCGAYQENIKLFDIILGVTASTDSNWANQFNVPQFSAGADFELAMTCFKKAKESGKNVFAGNILSADVFYDDDPDTWKKFNVSNMVYLLKPNSIKILIDCGTDDMFYDINCALHEQLAFRRIPHDFISRPGNHNWAYWTNSVKYHLLFFDSYFKEEAEKTAKAAAKAAAEKKK